MKQLRLAAIAAVVAVSGFAVSNANASKARVAQTWYRIADAPTNDQFSYQLAGSESCLGGSRICKILAEKDPSVTTQDVPLLSAGDPASNPTAYSASFRPTN
ncbi:hypothetical protein SAMN05660909_04484 [Chitinophaga terrae (ex Kim and Jung 2007)]|uniref:Uncharacterized protein n=1 Tax=Chitinophaga terrae (ex Kim and Jung 2007) TaxID=408074 RepID=A0A1H4FN18_9BACT|nr:hypothetical protein [Chitinophaga terrae (ex Kim and Jung 2007)]GEP89013.1 hypothetical protein CTE07_06580 [Chitinophaga terrae (ex Kim and Jung 2007)]SEA97892.1 hypothetical protein SAMN05660909_04484 [Chitinophaga terrae (ex Kim and Jung 2007)]